ncbi:uncharacterized protein N7443_000704 [Penicillium atrosanguineum]|uniref:Uncharacterized protein n=1 Tax=Penicillium atrosanguineum TaxID=1132637 RepID=A0A9W9QC60_9EURO|nr:uncharacterized protein N7443_000704 [Penicillium atrosanguineum]KAJ5313820.1 hypothetical protein N7443_000704 [Penicillium atrosanguineum]KAJ5330991.1 hypothetical protein N7476_000774 [Penicillium atrosanguineum]
MIRPHLRQIALYRDHARLGLSTAVRYFSVSRVALEGQDQPFRQNGPSRGSAPSVSRGPRTLTKPSTSGTQNRGRPAKVIDARSFAAPRADGDSPKIIRNPRLRNIRPGNQAQGRKSKPAASKKAAAKGRKQPRSRGPKKFEVDEGEELCAAEIQQIEQDQAAKARPTPVRYEPRDINFSTLKETWPSIPTDTNARSAAVLEKLSVLSGRIPNGYIPPYELGRRIWKGQNVLFENEAEKIEAMQEVKRLAQLRADKMSQRKGDLVEPREVKFGAINAEDTKTLMETFAQGRYPTLEASKNQSAVLGEVIRNLRNNGTYQTAGKRPQFLAKVESLLSSSRVKRT